MRWSTSAHSPASSSTFSRPLESRTAFAWQSWTMYEASSGVRWRFTAVMRRVPDRSAAHSTSTISKRFSATIATWSPGSSPSDLKWFASRSERSSSCA